MSLGFISSTCRGESRYIKSTFGTDVTKHYKEGLKIYQREDNARKTSDRLTLPPPVAPPSGTRCFLGAGPPDLPHSRLSQCLLVDTAQLEGGAPPSSPDLVDLPSEA